MLATLSADDSLIVIALVGARLLVPLLIPRCPLVIVVALVLDGIDNSLLDSMTDVDLSADGPYQSWDKALDIYYLSIAYLSTLRNWTSGPAFRVGQFLFYFRLIGIVLFELLDSRAMLLLFPNTFEYFFILYEAVRLRYRPERCRPRFWVLAAAGLWVFVKLPQEYWIHIAQRDFTDTVTDTPAIGVGAAVTVLALVAVLLFVVRPRLPAADHGWRLRADPTPVPAGDAHREHAHRLRTTRPLLEELAEKIALLGLLCVIFTEILPGLHARPAQVLTGVGLIVCANAAISLGYARSPSAGVRKAGAHFAALVAANFALVLVASALLSDSDDFQLGAGVFFAFLITLIVWLFDAYKPLHDVRFQAAEPSTY